MGYEMSLDNYLIEQIRACDNQTEVYQFTQDILMLYPYEVIPSYIKDFIYGKT